MDVKQIIQITCQTVFKLSLINYMSNDLFHPLFYPTRVLVGSVSNRTLKVVKI